ncbi:MAG: hypothetical protein B6D41_04995 [Chloroflexi bacterium UTCFX4]|jgi:hypothetical protein|nr:MAG: hypothetical protein B6D41_04995 [Chloroflexi bacterium UTCFX4]
MKKWILFGALALILIANALWFYQAIGWNAVDDAYISYVYAQNALRGYGLTFNPSERVEGFSNFLWTAMMLPIVGAGWDVGRVSSALGVAFGIGTLALTIRFPKWLGVPAIVGWMAALFLAVDGSFALWSVSGLETPMMAFLLTLGAFLYVKENFQSNHSTGTTHSNDLLGRGFTRTNADIKTLFGFIRANPRLSASQYALDGNPGAWKFPNSGIIFALAAMTRPEAVAVFGLTAAHQFAWRMIDQRKFFTRADLIRIASFILIFIPYWLIRWRYYHSLLPNSFYAKVSVGGPIAQIMRGWEHTQTFVGAHLSWLILAPAVIALIVVCAQYVRGKRLETGDGRLEEARRAFFGFTYFAAAMLFYGAYIIYVGGDWSVGRFFVPFLAFAYLIIAAGIVFATQFIVEKSQIKNRKSKIANYISASIGIVLALALWFSSAYNGEYKIFIGGFDAALATHARIAAGKWLKQNVAPGTWIAVDAAGQVPYFSELPTLDMFGINDLHIGRMPVANLGSGTPGHEKFDLGYIIARAPKYVVIYGTLFDNVTEYKRANVKWTDRPELERFLTIYERR